MNNTKTAIIPSSPTPIHVPLVVVVVLSLLAGLTPVCGRVSYETWKFPCTNGKDATVALSEEFFQDKELEDKARKAFEENLGHFYEVLSTKIGNLKEQLRVLLDSYVSRLLLDVDDDAGDDAGDDDDDEDDDEDDDDE